MSQPTNPDYTTLSTTAASTRPLYSTGRACRSCRKRKTKCSSINSGGPCGNCLTRNIRCVSQWESKEGDPNSSLSFNPQPPAMYTEGGYGLNGGLAGCLPETPQSLAQGAVQPTWETSENRQYPGGFISMVDSSLGFQNAPPYEPIYSYGAISQDQWQAPSDGHQWLQNSSPYNTNQNTAQDPDPAIYGAHPGVHPDQFLPFMHTDPSVVSDQSPILLVTPNPDDTKDVEEVDSRMTTSQAKAAAECLRLHRLVFGP